MTMKIVPDPLVSPEHRMQEKEVAGAFSTMKIPFHAIDIRNVGHAAFDGRSEPVDVIVNTQLINHSV